MEAKLHPVLENRLKEIALNPNTRIICDEDVQCKRPDENGKNIGYKLSTLLEHAIIRHGNTPMNWGCTNCDAKFFGTVDAVTHHLHPGYKGHVVTGVDITPALNKFKECHDKPLLHHQWERPLYLTIEKKMKQTLKQLIMEGYLQPGPLCNEGMPSSRAIDMGFSYGNETTLEAGNKEMSFNNEPGQPNDHSSLLGAINRCPPPSQNTGYNRYSGRRDGPHTPRTPAYGQDSSSFTPRNQSGGYGNNRSSSRYENSTSRDGGPNERGSSSGANKRRYDDDGRESHCRDFQGNQRNAIDRSTSLPQNMSYSRDNGGSNGRDADRYNDPHTPRTPAFERRSSLSTPRGRSDGYGGYQSAVNSQSQRNENTGPRRQGNEDEGDRRSSSFDNANRLNDKNFGRGGGGRERGNFQFEGPIKEDGQFTPRVPSGDRVEQGEGFGEPKRLGEENADASKQRPLSNFRINTDGSGDEQRSRKRTRSFSASDSE